MPSSPQWATISEAPAVTHHQYRTLVATRIRYNSPDHRHCLLMQGWLISASTDHRAQLPFRDLLTTTTAARAQHRTTVLTAGTTNRQINMPRLRGRARTATPILGGLQTPTSMTDIAALPSGHESNYMPSTSSAMSVGAGTSVHTPVQSQHQAHDYSALSGGYTHGSASYVQSSPSYQTAPSQPHHAHHSSLDQVSYSSALPDQSVPATANMLLNQSLPPNFYQQDETSYPTPTHAKPPPWG
jgi:hypothetical protein